MPITPPNWLDRVNFVLDYIFNPCDNPAVLYYETAKPALFKSILTYLSWGMDDVVRGFFRPKGLRSARHGRRKRRGKEKLIWPEIGEIIGGNLPGAEKVQGRHVTDGVKNLWIIDGWVQRLAYKILIIDLITEFAYEWTSGLMIAGAQNCANRVAALRGPDGFGSALPLRFTPTNMTNLAYAHGVHPLEYSCDLGPGNWFVAFGGNVQLAWIDQTARSTCSCAVIVNNDFGGDNNIWSSEVVCDPGEGAQILAAGFVQGPAKIAWYFVKSGGNWENGTAHLFITKYTNTIGS